MRVIRRKYKDGQIDIGLIYGGLAIIAVIACRFLPILDLLPPCSFKAYFGISCPTCGTTRSLVHLANGEFVAAFAMNPLTAGAVIFASMVFFYRLMIWLADAVSINIVLSIREQRILAIGLIVFFLLNWVYLIFFL